MRVEAGAGRWWGNSLNAREAQLAPLGLLRCNSASMWQVARVLVMRVLRMLRVRSCSGTHVHVFPGLVMTAVGGSKSCISKN